MDTGAMVVSSFVHRDNRPCSFVEAEFQALQLLFHCKLSVVGCEEIAPSRPRDQCRGRCYGTWLSGQPQLLALASVENVNDHTNNAGKYQNAGEEMCRERAVPTVSPKEENRAPIVHSLYDQSGLMRCALRWKGRVSRNKVYSL